MAGSVNKVILVGNLGADPEIRRTQDGRPIANLRLATSDSWRDKATGERREKTEWHRVVIFNENLCRIAEQYLKKGEKPRSPPAVRFAVTWTTKSRSDRYQSAFELRDCTRLAREFLRQRSDLLNRPRDARRHLRA